MNRSGAPHLENIDIESQHISRLFRGDPSKFEGKVLILKKVFVKKLSFIRKDNFYNLKLVLTSRGIKSFFSKCYLF